MCVTAKLPEIRFPTFHSDDGDDNPRPSRRPPLTPPATNERSPEIRERWCAPPCSPCSTTSASRTTISYIHVFIVIISLFLSLSIFVSILIDCSDIPVARILDIPIWMASVKNWIFAFKWWKRNNVQRGPSFFPVLHTGICDGQRLVFYLVDPTWISSFPRNSIYYELWFDKLLWWKPWKL